MITTYPFFETKLVVISLEKFGEFLLFFFIIIIIIIYYYYYC